MCEPQKAASSLQNNELQIAQTLIHSPRAPGSSPPPLYRTFSATYAYNINTPILKKTSVNPRNIIHRGNERNQAAFMSGDTVPLSRNEPPSPKTKNVGGFRRLSDSLSACRNPGITPDKGPPKVGRNQI